MSEAAYFPVFRGHVNTWQCDVMGHMNVQFYLAMMTDGMAHLRNRFGMSPSYIEETGHTMVALSALVRYRKELLAGDIVSYRVAMQKVGEKSITFVAEVINEVSGEIAATLDIVNVSFNLKTRKSVPWPAEMRAAMQAAITPRTDDPRARGTGAAPAVPEGVTPGNPVEVYKSSINPWQCDEFGHLSAHFYHAIASDAAAHTWAILGMDQDLIERERLGGAVVETDTRFLKELRAGELVTAEAGVLELGNKTIRYGYRFYNGKRDVVASYEALAVVLDLERRRAAPVPDFMRENARRIWLAEWPPAL